MFNAFLTTFILGTIIGSFLNVVILRYNTGRGINGRSGCLTCGHKLSASELIPIVSWIIQRGKCKNCNAKISVQYPLVELGMGLLFVGLLYSTLPFWDLPTLVVMSFAWNAIIFSILAVIFVYDLRHKIIPDGMSYAFAVMGLIQTLLLNPITATYTTLSWLNLLAGPIMFAPFALLWLVSGGRWIGFGDAKLALGIGWYLGFIHGLSAIVLGFWIGAVFAIALLLIDRLKLVNKTITMKTEIPFAPFLIIGTIIEFFIRVDVIGVGLFF